MSQGYRNFAFKWRPRTTNAAAKKIVPGDRERNSDATKVRTVAKDEWGGEEGGRGGGEQVCPEDMASGGPGERRPTPDERAQPRGAREGPRP